MERKVTGALLLAGAMATSCARFPRGTGQLNLTPTDAEKRVTSPLPDLTKTSSDSDFEIHPTSTEPFTPTVTLTETPPPTPYRLFDIDFSDLSKKLTFTINLSSDKTFKIETTPTLDCNTKGNGGFAPRNLTSCEYQPWENPEDLFHFVHSGWWKDSPTTKLIELPAEELRHFIEDLYYPRYCKEEKCAENEFPEQVTPEVRDQKMAKFVGKPIQIAQENGASTVLQILGVARIPPDKVDILNNNRDSLIELLAQIDPNFAKYKIDGTPQIFIVFCGWYNPDEEKNLILNPRPNSYEWSRIVVVAGKKE